jgi:bifunctional DNA-binding transcriptional regulator/antitoxin component of YhaV-PrlF toxin-antitoxin module
MQQVVSITSQGQITIPASFRRFLGLDQYPKAVVSTNKNQLIIEPIPDVLSLAGTLFSKAKKNQNIQQTIKQENTAISTTISQKYTLKK